MTPPTPSGLPNKPASVASEFDVVKELNAHLGRIGTVLRLMTTAAAVTVWVGPTHDALASIPAQGPSAVSTALVSLGANLAFGMLFLLMGMDPPIPDVLSSARGAAGARDMTKYRLIGGERWTRTS